MFIHNICLKVHIDFQPSRTHLKLAECLTFVHWKYILIFLLLRIISSEEFDMAITVIMIIDLN